MINPYGKIAKTQNFNSVKFSPSEVMKIFVYECNIFFYYFISFSLVLPIPPKIISIKKGATYLTFHWKEVRNAYKYIIDVRSNKSLELVNTEYTSITLNQLTSNTTYYIAIQSISFAGESNFTLTKSVTTRTSSKYITFTTTNNFSFKVLQFDVVTVSQKHTL